jgi:putative transposase
MSHSYSKIWLHSIFATKERLPLILERFESAIYQHLKEQLVEMSCPVRVINGMPDHVHSLYLQNPKISVIDVLKQMKGNTSFWINHQDIIDQKFGWQTGYAVYSVSESQLDKVAQYIANQKIHHAKKSFEEEFRDLAILHGLTEDH